MSSEGIKPGHVSISEVPPEPGSQRSPPSFPSPVVPVPNLGAAPKWSVPAIAYVLALLLFITAGVSAGHATVIGPPASTLGAGLSLLLLVAGIIETARGRPTQEQKRRLVVAVLLVGFCTITVLADPFLNVFRTGRSGLFVPLGWLVPILLAGVWFARRRCWFQAIGVALFVFVSISLLSSNLTWGSWHRAGFLVKIELRE